jgi:hypothetical protein
MKPLSALSILILFMIASLIGLQTNAQTETNKLVLKAEGESGADYTQISFESNSTPQFDEKYDIKKMLINSSKRPLLFSYADSIKLFYNFLPDTTAVNLGVWAGVDAHFTISIEENINFEFVVLEDLILNQRTDLLEEDYTFKYFTTDLNYPFKLYFKEWFLVPPDNDDIEVFYFPDQLTVRSKKLIDIAEITIFDLAGREALQFVEKDFFVLEKNILLPEEHYIVRVRNNYFNKRIKIFVGKRR